MLEQYIFIRARFIGTDSSLGYRRHKFYNLKVQATDGMSIELSDGSGGFCPYYSLSAFLEDWDNINRLSYKIS